MVCSLVSRYRVLFGGRKMMRLSLPAVVWVAVMLGLVTCQRLGAAPYVLPITYHKAPYGTVSATLTITTSAYSTTLEAEGDWAVLPSWLVTYTVQWTGPADAQVIASGLAGYSGSSLTAYSYTGYTATKTHRLKEGRLLTPAIAVSWWEGSTVYGSFTVGDLSPQKQQPSEPVIRKGPTQKVDNPFDFPVTYTYKDSLTGETLAVLNLAPGETGLAGLEKKGNNAVSVTMTLPSGGIVNGADSEGSPVNYTYPPGTTLAGSPIPDSAFSNKASAPAWQAPVAVTAPVPPVALATMTPNPGGPTVPQARTKATNPVLGKADRVQYTTVSQGVGGATDDTLREGVGAIVGAIQGSGTVDTGEVGTDPASEGVTEWQTADASKAVDQEPPVFFTGAFPSTTVISANLDMFGGTRTWSFDASQFATPISWFRALCSVIVHFAMFVLVTKTGRSAAAS